MKKIILPLLVTITCFMQINLAAQSYSFKKADTITLLRDSKIKWYADWFRGRGSNLQVSPQVLGSKKSGGIKTEIGVGLHTAASSFSFAGSERDVSGNTQVCRIQPMAFDFTTGDEFSLYTGPAFIEPGQFFNIASVLNNSYSSFNGPARKAYQLGMTIFNPDNPAPNVLDVTNLTRSAQPEIQSQLLAPNFGAAIPASGVMSLAKVNSDIELKGSLSASQGVFLPLEQFGIPLELEAGIKGSINGSSAVNLKYYALNYFQPMYTLNVLTNHQYLFADSNAYRGCANGAYVQSVTYGRRVLIIIGSSKTETTIKAALSAALSATITGNSLTDLEVGSEVSGETNARLREVAELFYAKVWGGDAEQALPLFTDIGNFRDRFHTFITSASAGTFTERTGALPLSFTLRRLSDGALISVRSYGSFEDIVSCKTSTYSVDVLWKGFTVNSVMEVPFDDKEDIWGKLKVTSATINGSLVGINGTVRNITRDNAISVARGRSDRDDVTVRVMNGLSTDQISGTTLNFSQAFYDWEPLHNPAYRETSSAALKFNLSNRKNRIRALLPGQSVTFDMPISLRESTPIGTSRITLNTKIRVSKQ